MPSVIIPSDSSMLAPEELLYGPCTESLTLQFNRRFFVPDENEIILLQVLVIRIGGVLNPPQLVLAAQAQYDWLGTVLIGQKDVGVFHT